MVRQMRWWTVLFAVYFLCTLAGVVVAVVVERMRTRHHKRKLGTVYGGPVGNGTERAARLREASLEAERRKG